VQKYLDQAKHNKTFHASICTTFPDHYYDWKITVVFYKAIHYMKAFIKDKAKHTCHSHEEVDHFVNPESQNVKLAISKAAWRNYKNLYTYSRNARYEGIPDKTLFDSQFKRDHEEALKSLNNLKLYLKSRGLAIEVDASIN
jgi:hypothetical protein